MASLQPTSNTTFLAQKIISATNMRSTAGRCRICQLFISVCASLANVRNGFVTAAAAFMTTPAVPRKPSAFSGLNRQVSPMHPVNVAQGRPAAPSLPSKVSETSLKMGRWDPTDELEGSDRLKACIPYLLPLLDGDQFGYYIYERIPVLGFLNDLLLGPLLGIFHAVPFMGVMLFCAFTLGTRFNTDISRNVRFSAQQAALIDLALIVPELIAVSFQEDPLPRYISEPCSNFVWYAYTTSIVYCVVANQSNLLC